MRVLSFLSFMVVLFCGFFINAAKPRNLIIINNLLSESSGTDAHIGAMGVDLICALNARNAIILVGNAILDDVGRYAPTNYTNWQSGAAQWYVFSVNEDVSLLIPKNLFGISRPEDFLSEMTRLGLNGRKLTYLQTLDEACQHRAVQPKPQIADAQQEEKMCGLHMHNAFLEVIDLRNRTPWNIFLTGHGSPLTIAGFPTGSFQNILQLLNQTAVNALIYSTCYGGGKHLREPYYDENNDPIRLNYAVACCCSRYAPSFVEPEFDFRTLFDSLNNQRQSWTGRFVNAFQSLLPRQQDGIDYRYQNVPWVIEPGQTKFKLLPLAMQDIRTYTIQDERHQEDEPVHINAPLKALLLDAPRITRSLTFAKGANPSIISLKDDGACHYIRSLHANDYQLHTLARDLFSPVSLPYTPKASYVIDSIKRYDGSGEEQEYRNVTMQTMDQPRWMRLSNILKYGLRFDHTTYPAKFNAGMGKIITAVRSDDRVTQAVMKPRIYHPINKKILYKYLAPAALLATTAVASNLSGILGFKGSALLGLTSLALPGYMWAKSKHVDFDRSKMQVEWPQTITWQTLSARAAARYKDEYQCKRERFMQMQTV